MQVVQASGWSDFFEARSERVSKRANRRVERGRRRVRGRDLPLPALAWSGGQQRRKRHIPPHSQPVDAERDGMGWQKEDKLNER